MPPQRHASVATARALRSVAYLLNLHSACLCTLGCLAVYGCERLGLSFALDISMIVFGVTFAVTFTITQSYQRRERALATIAELKATIIAMYWQHRDWSQSAAYPASMGDDGSAWAQEFAGAALEFLGALEAYFGARDKYESVAEVRLAANRKAVAQLLLGTTDTSDRLGLTFMERVQTISTGMPGHRHLMRAYGALSKISVLNEYLTHKAHYMRGGEGGMSRTAQYLRYLVAHTEQLRMIKIYRTPTMLRAACSVLVHTLTIVLGPYFVHVGKCDAAPGAEEPGFGAWCPAPYIMVCLWVLITTLLLNVQDANEHPLDMSGVDDVFLSLSDEFRDVLAEGRIVGTVYDDGSCFDQWREQFGAKWPRGADALATAMPAAEAAAKQQQQPT
ncbi:MAG: hypothetical protein J3K34DRAFT_439060 [Monoraphidium minutum]|nr:MAG: hypothetical protein J3K34DRAFT_439060 [Monoraphidium minutum]